MIALKLAYRLLKPSQSDSIFKSLGIVTIFGICIGVATLIMVYSIFLGFEKKLKSIIVDSYPHIVLEKRFEGGANKNLKFVEEVLGEHTNVSAWTPFSSYQGLLAFNGKVKGVQLNGVDWESFKKVVPFERFLIGDKVQHFGPGEIIVGVELQKALNLKIDDELKFVFSTEEGKNLVEVIKVKGFFQVGRYEQDLKYCYVNRQWLAQVLNQKEVAALGVKLKNPESIESTLDDIHEKLLFSYQAQSWKDIDRNFLESIVLERRLMIIILSLIVLVAGFNVMSMLMIISRRKMRECAILLAMGTTPLLLKRIFLWMGGLMSIAGVLGGILMAWILSFIITRYPLIELPADVYQLSRLPVSLNIPFIAAISVFCFVLCFVSIYIPAVKISKMNPVEGLHYE
ncbi:MAG TPA: ABC transporter permease [Bdellovibrionota bacterium]|nr:ABC transporter permease [Bdellovibrionota bacterium]